MKFVQGVTSIIDLQFIKHCQHLLKYFQKTMEMSIKIF
jgi:hypothetical protein